MPLWVNIVNIALYVIAGLFVVFGFYNGWKRGATRQMFRIFFIAGAAVLAAFATKGLFNVIYNFCADKTLWEILEETKIATVFKLDGDFEEVIRSLDVIAADYLVPLLLSFVVLPILYVPIFFVFCGLMLLLGHALLIVFNYPDHNFDDFNRLVSAFLGGILGLAIALVTFVPAAGLLKFSADTVDTLYETDPDGEATETYTDFYIENFEPLNNHPLIQWTQKLGGSLLFDYFSLVEYEGEPTDMQSEAQAVVRVGIRAYSMHKNTDWADLTQSDKNTLEAMIADLTDHPYIRGLSASVLQATGGFLAEKVEGLDGIEEPVRTILSEMVGTFAEITEDSLKTDLETVRTVYFLLSDTGVLRTMNKGGDMTAALARTNKDGKTVLALVIGELDKNAHTRAITSALTDVSFAILLGNTDMGEETMEKIRQVKDDVTSALNGALALNEEDYESHEDYVAAIADRVDGALTENGVELDDAILGGVAGYIADPEHFTDENGNRLTYLSGTDLSEFAISYFASVAENA